MLWPIKGTEAHAAIRRDIQHAHKLARTETKRGVRVPKIGRLVQRLGRNSAPSNAVKYTDLGGVLIGCRRRGGQLWIEIYDTGIGILEDKVKTIFGKFRSGVFSIAALFSTAGPGP